MYKSNFFIVSLRKNQAIFSGRPVTQSKFLLLCIKFELIEFSFFANYTVFVLVNDPLSLATNKDIYENW